MPFRLGNGAEPRNIYIGATQVEKAYVGAQQVWPNTNSVITNMSLDYIPVFSTRNQAVSYVTTAGAEGFDSLPDGTRFTADGLLYRKQAGASFIPDMPGVVPDGEVIYFEHFGAVSGDAAALASGEVTAAKVVATGAQDCRSAGNAAMSYLIAKGGGEVSARMNRVYLIDDAIGSQWSLEGGKNITIRGAAGAMWFFDDKPSVEWTGSNRLLKLSNSKNITIQDLDIYSTLREYSNAVTNGRIDNRKMLFSGSDVENISMINVRVTNVRSFTSSFRQVSGGQFTRCSINGGGRDGIRCINYENVQITDCFFKDVSDDVVALHSSYTPSNVEQNKIPMQSIVKGCIVDGGYGMRFLGPKSLRVVENTFHRTIRHAIEVKENDDTHPEGRTAIVALEVSGNHIIDPLSLRVSSSDGVSGAIKIITQPMERVSGDIPFEEFAPYTQIHQHDTGLGDSIGGDAIKIRNNTIKRTLPSVSRYTDWGLGEYADRAYGSDRFWSNPAVRDDDFVQIGIYLKGAMIGVDVSGNEISGLSPGGAAIMWRPSDSPIGTELIGRIHHNRTRDVPSDQIDIGSGRVNVDIVDNDFIGDPYVRASNHNANFSWDNSANVRGVVTTNTDGWISIRRNKGQFISRMCNRDEDLVDYGENIVFSDFVTPGYSTDNKGVGNLATQDTTVYVDLNKSSSNFRNINKHPKHESVGMPSTGNYLSGHFVRKLTPVPSEGKIVLGWTRITTGDQHVLGVDWQQVQVDVAASTG